MERRTWTYMPVLSVASRSFETDSEFADIFVVDDVALRRVCMDSTDPVPALYISAVRPSRSRTDGDTSWCDVRYVMPFNEEYAAHT